MVCKDTHFARHGFCDIKKSRPIIEIGRESVYAMKNLFSDLSFDGKDGDKRLAFFLLLELDNAIAQGIQGVILAHADVLARIVFCAALTNDDVASNSGLSTEEFDSESLTS